MLHGLFAANTDGSYLIYVLGSVVVGGLAGWRWIAKKVDQLVAWAGPLLAGFVQAHNEAVVALKDNLVETSRSTSAIHEKLASVHDTLDKHGEKLANIDRRTAHLDRSALGK